MILLPLVAILLSMGKIALFTLLLYSTVYNNIFYTEYHAVNAQNNYFCVYLKIHQICNAN